MSLAWPAASIPVIPRRPPPSVKHAPPSPPAYEAYAYEAEPGDYADLPPILDYQTFLRIHGLTLPPGAEPSLPRLVSS